MRPDRDTHRVVKAATTLARVGIALLLGYAGILKIQNPDAPREFIASVLYADLPWIVGIVAVLEILLAAWLFAGYRAGRAATAAFALFRRRVAGPHRPRRLRLSRRDRSG